MNNIIEPAKYPAICKNCANHLIVDGRVLVRRKELERLQRLDKNVRTGLESRKNLLSDIAQGLYDENTQENQE